MSIGDATCRSTYYSMSALALIRLESFACCLSSRMHPANSCRHAIDDARPIFALQTHSPRISRHSMISTESPGKIVKKTSSDSLRETRCRSQFLPPHLDVSCLSNRLRGRSEAYRFPTYATARLSHSVFPETGSDFLVTAARISQGFSSAGDASDLEYRTDPSRNLRSAPLGIYCFYVQYY